jgi:hypothetical protein
LSDLNLSLLLALLGGLEYRRTHCGKATGLEQELNNARSVSRIGEVAIIVTAQHDYGHIRPQRSELLDQPQSVVARQLAVDERHVRRLIAKQLHASFSVTTAGYRYSQPGETAVQDIGELVIVVGNQQVKTSAHYAMPFFW